MIKAVRSLLGNEIETLEDNVHYNISTITKKSVKFEKILTSTPIYVPKLVFCNAEKELSSNWLPVRPLKEKSGTGYDGLLKSYTPTMISHIVAPMLARIGLCEVRKCCGHWEIRLRES